MVIHCRRLACGLALCLLITSCPDSRRSDEAYGLPAVYVDLECDALADLENNVFSNLRVPARLVYEQREYDVSMRNHGELGRFFLKKSYQVDFGEDDRFENRQRVILSSQHLDPALLRSRLAISLFRDAGFAAFEATPVVLFLNGDGCGVYHLIEPVDEYFFLNRGVEVGNCYKAIRRNARFTLVGVGDIRCSFEKTPVDDGDYSDLEQLIKIIDTAPSESLPVKLAPLIDIPGYLRYMAISVLITNADGVEHNFIIRRTKNEPFRLIPWDLDQTFRDHEWGVWGANRLTERLLELPEYRAYYRNYLLGLVNLDFREDRIFPRIDRLADAIREAYPNDPYLTAKGWDLDQAADSIKAFVRNRSQFLRSRLEE